MSPHPHAVFFPLASNANALLAGGPVESVRRRLKLCSLFFDTVLVEKGAISITAGPSGSMMFPVLPGKRGYRWQHPADRKPGGEPARLLVRMDGEPSEPWGLAMQTQATINWRPTFEPFRDELPREAGKWLHFAEVRSDPQLLKRVVKAGLREDQRIEALRQHFPDPMVRDQVLQGLNSDLAASGLGGVAVSVDTLHRRVLACRRYAGTAVPVCGPSSLRLLFPRVEHLPWAEIAELRDHKDIDAFRKILVEIEAAAAESESGFEDAVQKAYADAVAAAERRMNGSTLRRLGLHAFGLLTGVLLDAVLGGGIPGELMGIGLGEAAERGLQAAFAPKWRAFDRKLRERLDVQ